jgi:Tetratricopeptide repeat
MGSARDLEQALAICCDLGHRLGQANALLHLGNVRYLTGDHPGAAGDLEQTLAICRDLGDRGGEAEALHGTGTLHLLTGQWDRIRAVAVEAVYTLIELLEPLIL